MKVITSAALRAALTYWSGVACHTAPSNSRMSAGRAMIGFGISSLRGSQRVLAPDRGCCQAGPGRLFRLIGGQGRGGPDGCRENVQIPAFLEKNRIGRPAMGPQFLPAGRKRGEIGSAGGRERGGPDVEI